VTTVARCFSLLTAKCDGFHCQTVWKMLYATTCIFGNSSNYNGMTACICRRFIPTTAFLVTVSNYVMMYVCGTKHNTLLVPPMQSFMPDRCARYKVMSPVQSQKCLGMSILGTASAIVLAFADATRYMPWPCVSLSVCLSVASRNSIETSEWSRCLLAERLSFALL